ncbi:aprataxin and PNK-like factor isoform X2 [Fukomys damarensis]|uniref:aprataxin and PNK-like factor isoform X2 n=1 Tax=Fukomys damarensis TaxID=885580 RepID=UPI00053FBC93|nr:aprataxin and PNK-like factor isoform X2 [Fukomys damarensis]
MSGCFELQPQDGGPRVALALGETVIGRGPLLGITDRRISRRHAILEVVGGQLRIKPIHTNPCFYRSSENSQLLPMKTNLWHWLNPGDSFSLLVDKHIFCVVSTHSEMEIECTLRNSQMLDEDDILNEAPKSPVINLLDKTTGTPHLEKTTDITETQTTSTSSMSPVGECRGLSKQQSHTAQRKRILPAWMLEDLSDQNLLDPVICGDNSIIQGSRKEGICKEKTYINVTQKGRKRISSGNSESVSGGQNAGKKCKDTDQEESVILCKEMPESFSATTLSNPDMHTVKINTQRNEIPIVGLAKVSKHKVMTKGTLTQEDKAVSCAESCSSVQGKSFHSESQRCHPKSNLEASSSETLQTKATDSLPQSSQENKVKRSSCMYGANCYRKNPVHFQHFSHPGDNDYGGMHVTGQDETDDRPECPYGASCYRNMENTEIGLLGCRVFNSVEKSGAENNIVIFLRKNLQHKIEYRHSILQVRSVSDEDDVGRPSEYDLNDSFLDDEGEEYEPTDEDSDWEPGKEDQAQEDVEELLKEARKFMKRKK